MADRLLVNIFPEASLPLSAQQAETFLCSAKKSYGEIDTFFGLPVYQNPVGIEVEVENFSHYDFMPLYWQTTDDASLKMNGAELISVPLRGRNIDYALHEFGKISMQSNWKFTHRTSVHVHCNVSSYTKHQLRALMAIYACAEELYFGFVNDFRKGNSFCYHLVGTPAEMKFYQSDKEGCECTKYCAFNIQPVSRQMTVEFRHLEGTDDLKKLRRWIQLCSKLVGGVLLMNPRECTEILIKALQGGGMSTLIMDLLGDTGKSLFTERQVNESVNNGELWALAILTKE